MRTSCRLCHDNNHYSVCSSPLHAPLPCTPFYTDSTAPRSGPHLPPATHTLLATVAGVLRISPGQLRSDKPLLTGTLPYVSAPSSPNQRLPRLPTVPRPLASPSSNGRPCHAMRVGLPTTVLTKPCLVLTIQHAYLTPWTSCPLPLATDSISRLVSLSLSVPVSPPFDTADGSSPRHLFPRAQV
jgi:hypothetical protein